MKLFAHGKDGGPESYVDGWWLVEFKPLFSIALLRFKDGSRESFHSHAFNSVSWLLKGELLEEHIEGNAEVHVPSLKPIRTFRSTFHRVFSRGTSWVLTFRGPWSRQWNEFDPKNNKSTVLTHGRRVIGGVE